jgi:hypothetical protein
MAHKEGADEAIKEPNPTIDGRRANVNLAYLGAKNRTAAYPRMLKIFSFIILFHFIVHSQLQSPCSYANISIKRCCCCLSVRIYTC